MSDSRYDDEATENENLCCALWAIADALRQLGFNNSNDPHGPGAIEGHTMMLRDTIVPAICESIDHGFRVLGEAIESRGAR